MPRQRRICLDRSCYHITHRCHERSFLFRFSKYRDLYLKYLIDMNKRHKVEVLDYMITSNHVHLLVWSKRYSEIPVAIQYLHSRVAQEYNHMKNREGTFWKDRYHSTLVKSGYHLSRCLFYIDMNMIRCGAVQYPENWKHTGHHEIIGAKQRYRVINVESLMGCLGMSDYKPFRNWYIETLNAEVEGNYYSRIPLWTESIAVGDKKWIEDISADLPSRKKKILYAALPESKQNNIQFKVQEEKIFYLAE